MSRTTLRSPGRFHWRVWFAVALLLALPRWSLAEQAGQPPAPSAPQAQAPETEKPPADTMGAMMGTMMEANMKAFISLLGKPETAEKMAAFTKNYYDALVAKGFTKDEALRIVTAAGVANIAGQK